MNDLKQLSRDEMKDVKGGYMLPPDGGVGSAYCIGSVGAWYYPDGNVSYDQCSHDIAVYCRSGHGGCNAG